MTVPTTTHHHAIIDVMRTIRNEYVRRRKARVSSMQDDGSVFIDRSRMCAGGQPVPTRGKPSGRNDIE
ncbi:hypothetical protein NQ315_009598 [Exocentrus adspersus]|uniref:Uncharacterized protein n=1 Tax=Exocentrus adspersus TaxID=1586481 RepID=A0AAV8WG75_9CUCU|nr:hypothetical protein NQ315_009598 [Exocentrus adspersus]